MDVHDALAVLDLPHEVGYYGSPIPCPEDSRIGRVVKAFTGAEPDWQTAFRAGVDRDRAELLCAWSERVAALAVRLDSSRPLVIGLAGLALASEPDGDAALLVAPLHRRSAEKLGADPMRIFDEAAGLSDLAGGRWLREARDSEEQIEDAGYAEDEDADGFRYMRTAGAMRRGH